MLASLLACGDAPDPNACGSPYAGDRAQAIATRPFALDVSGDETSVVRRDLQGGDLAPLIVPQQGGFVVYAGVALKNVDACHVTVSAEFLDDKGAALTNRDTRQADYVASPDGDGWYLPRDLAALNTVPNIPVCPNLLGAPLVDVPAVLHFHVVDRDGRVADLRSSASPSCVHPATRAFCECVCGPDYQPGKCSPDAGAGDGG